MLRARVRLTSCCVLLALATLLVGGCRPKNSGGMNMGMTTGMPAGGTGGEGGTSSAPAPASPSSGSGSPSSPTANECGPSNKIVAVPGSGVTWSPGSFPAPSFSSPLLTQINNYRATLGLNPLTWHDALGLVAQQHVADMQNNNYFGLVGPSGVDMCQQLVSSSPPLSFDDLFAFVVQFPNPGTPTQAFADLLSNPASKAVIETPAVTQFGSYYSANAGTVLFGVNVTP